MELDVCVLYWLENQVTQVLVLTMGISVSISVPPLSPALPSKEPIRTPKNIGIKRHWAQVAIKATYSSGQVDL